MGREDFLVSASNEDAVAAIDRFPDWSPKMIALIGPLASGKSHLGEVWRAESGAQRFTAADLDEAAVAAVMDAGAGLIEDLGEPLGEAGEAALFHLLNACVQGRVFLVLTARMPVESWTVATPDVATRLKLVPSFALRPPDDALFAALVMKLMADRQLTVAANAVRFALPRLERSFAAASRFVDAVERKALERRRTATLGVVREVVAEMEQAS